MNQQEDLMILQVLTYILLIIIQFAKLLEGILVRYILGRAFHFADVGGGVIDADYRGPVSVIFSIFQTDLFISKKVIDFAK